MKQEAIDTTDGIGPLIQNLCSKRPDLREEAEVTLKRLTPNQVDQLVRILRAEPKKILGRVGLWFSVMSWPMVLMPVWVASSTGSGNYMSCAVFVAFLASYMVLFPLLVVKPRFQSALLYCLTHVDAAELLGPLITYSGCSTTRPGWASHFQLKLYGRRLDRRVNIDRSLSIVLEMVKSGDDLDLTESERTGLTQRLLLRNHGVVNSANPEIVIEILRLLEVIGDSIDLPNLKVLERGSQFGTDVKTAAARCREIVEARLLQQQIPETLLRASQSSSPTKELVRPVVTNAPAEEQVLVRASQVEETLMH